MQSHWKIFHAVGKVKDENNEKISQSAVIVHASINHCFKSCWP